MRGGGLILLQVVEVIELTKLTVFAGDFDIG
jgi:hypothetical protein